MTRIVFQFLRNGKHTHHTYLISESERVSPTDVYELLRFPKTNEGSLTDKVKLFFTLTNRRVS